MSDNEEYFNYFDKKYISHIDTFYYAVYVDSPFCDDWSTFSIFDGVKDFFSELKKYKDESIKQKKPIEFMPEVFKDVFFSPFRRFSIYSFCLTVKDKFDIFIADYLPNNLTPPVFVQLRSSSLWLDGVYGCFDMSFSLVDCILSEFGINISKLVENRVDYAFHTNYIQDVANFFPMKKIAQMQVSNFEQGSTHFYINGDDTFTDYFTLGRRKSNNVFFRVYDKTKEVIEMGYKHFFIPIWYNQGLINKFDYEVLTNCAKMGNDWSNIDKCRAKFYIEHGADKELISKLQKLFDTSSPAPAFSEAIKGIVPRVTTVCNIEFQVKRKFFDRLKYDSLASSLDIKDFERILCFDGDDNCRGYIYNFLGCTKSITDFLTWNTLRFVRYKSKKDKAIPKHKRELADFWKRLRSCEQLEILSSDCKVYRDYQTNIDKDLIVNSLVSKMATYSAYFSYDSSEPWSADEVSSDILNHLNDNDLCNKFEDKATQKRNELRRYYNIDSDDFEQLCL